jgi:hypothetical protein
MTVNYRDSVEMSAAEAPAINYRALMSEMRKKRLAIMKELGITEEAPALTVPRRRKTSVRARTSSSERARRAAAAAEAETAAAVAAGKTRKRFRTNLALLAEMGMLPARHAIGAPRVKVAGHGAHTRKGYTLRSHTGRKTWW